MGEAPTRAAVERGWASKPERPGAAGAKSGRQHGFPPGGAAAENEQMCPIRATIEAGGLTGERPGLILK
jgi:hypothetical protein